MQMEEVALRIVYSFLYEPERLAFRTSSQIHAQLPVRCEFSKKHCIWDLYERIQGGPCGAPCDIPAGVCTRCYKFSCHAHTFAVFPSLATWQTVSDGPWYTVRRAKLFTRRTLCLACQVQEGFLEADMLARWESNSPPDPFAA